jgi:hypothetical protein
MDLREDAAARHLVLVYRPGWQSLADLQEIRRHVAELDESIEVFIVSGTEPNFAARKRAARRPTLVVSPGIMPSFRPRRGRVYTGFLIPKYEQSTLLAAAGVPVPRTAILTPDLRLDEAAWGEFVIVKPTYLPASSHGRGIHLMRTSRVRYIEPAAFPADHPGRWGPMLVQQFIDTGDRISAYRVLTLFGEPLYLTLDRASKPRVTLSATDDVIESAVIATQSVDTQERDFPVEADVLSLARAAHDAIPEAPLKGCDILREAATGKLYVLEVNPGGNTWHFSSNHLAADRARNGPEFEARRRSQFDAMRTAARVLVERTVREAE